MKFSLVIPAFNEATKIEKDLVAAHEFLKHLPYETEVLVIDDGSRDATSVVAGHICKKLTDPKTTFRVLDYGANRGKGFAVRYGILKAQGDIIAFADSGLCVPFKFLEKGIQAIQEGADYAIANRRHSNTKITVQQPVYRRAGSKIFWIVVKGFMGIRASDTQCGFKLYSKTAAKEIFTRSQIDGFMFDIEALTIAQKLGLKLAEFPVEWSNDSDTRYHPVWGTLRNFKELLKIRLRSVYA